MAQPAVSISEAPAKKAAAKIPNRFMLSFGTKYGKVYDRLIRDAEADDRDPGEFVVRWLDKNYEKIAAELKD